MRLGSQVDVFLLQIIASSGWSGTLCSSRLLACDYLHTQRGNPKGLPYSRQEGGERI